MPDLTRTALIDAAAKAWTDSPLPGDFARRRAADVLDAILPLIADAIEAARLSPSVSDTRAIGMLDAADLVRSLMGADDG